MVSIMTAFSIILASYTFIWSLWSSEIKKSLDLREESGINKANNKKNYNHVSNILSAKQYPLSIISIIITLIMLPDCIKIIKESVKLIRVGCASYDVIKTTIVFLFGMFIFITILQIKKTINLHNKKKKLEYK